MRDPSRPRAFAVAVVAGAAVPLLALLLAVGATDALDAAVIEAVRGPERAWLGPLTVLGSFWVVVSVAAAVLVIGWFANHWREAMAGAMAIGLAAAGIELVKLLIARARPDLLDPVIVETGFSFPSGHAANATVAYGILAWLIGRVSGASSIRALAWALAVAVAIGVGLSRVWLGVHYPSDVVAGWLLGIAVVALVAALNPPASPAPGAAAAREDPAAPRSGPPAAG